MQLGLNKFHSFNNDLFKNFLFDGNITQSFLVNLLLFLKYLLLQDEINSIQGHTIFIYGCLWNLLGVVEELSACE